MTEEELVEKLRNCASNAGPCRDCDMISDPSCTDTLMNTAADVIEELCAIREEQKAQIILMAAGD